MSGRARATLAAAAVLLVLGAIFVRVHGWGDWTAGTSTSYCGVYVPHLDAYCQSGH